MKQKLLNSIRLRAMMLVAVMCAAFAGQAWATDVTFTPGTDTGATSVTKSGVTATMTTMNNSSYYQIYANQSATFSVASGNITKIEFTCTASGTTKYGPGNSSANVGSYSYSGSTGTWTGEASSVTISSTAQVRMTSLTITYTAAAPSYTITAVRNNDSYGTVSLTGTTITATPAAGYRVVAGDGGYTVTLGSATVTNNGDNTFSVTPSSDCTVQINFEAIPTHTATFSVNGNTSRTATVAEGAAITFPEAVETTPGDGEFPKIISGKTFVGWYTSTYSNASVAPSYVNTATAKMGATDMTYYAVYADVAEEVSEDMEDAVKSQTLQYDSWTYSGTTTDKSSYRLFGNGSYIQSAAFDLSKLMKVVVYGGTFGGESTYNSGTIGDGTNIWNDITLTGNGNSKAHTFTGGTALSGTKALRITSTAGNGTGNGLRISKVEIYVKGTTRTESNYTTDIRSEAGISFAEAEVSVQLKSGYAGQALTNSNSVTVAYSSSDETVATVNGSTGAIELLKAGTTTITATFAGDATYKPAEVSYELTVTEKLPNGLAYAVAEVEKQTTDATFTNALTNSHSLSVSYSSSATGVAIVDSSTGEVTIKGAGETTITASFTGDEDYEAGNASYTLKVSKATPTLNFAKSSVNVELDEGTYKQVVTTEPADLPVTYTSSKESVATVASDGTVTLLTTGSTTITANFAGNDLYKSANASYTLNVDVSTPLPFSFDGGKSDVASKTGLTQNGLGSDYGSSPKLKFDGTGDNLILKYTGSANVLTFDIVGNSFSGGTFKVQYSEDGVNYTDLETYDDLSAKQSESFDNIPASARYIKWIYTEKVSGNVGLGNISLNECEAITVGSAGYTTHVTSHKVSVPDGVTAYIATATGASTVTLSTIEKVPASTAIILKADEGSYKLPVTEESTDDVSDNLLLASDGSVAGNGTTIYALGVGKTGVNEGVVGFYLVNKDQTIPAGKAYLTTGGGAVKEFLTFDFDDATAIAKIQDSGSKIQDSEIFNLAGQKMSTFQELEN